MAHPVLTTHSHIPNIGLDNNVFFEFLVFIQSIIVLGCQYMNLYKTVWWLPHSTANYAVNFQLIDANLSILLIIIMGRRFIYSVIYDLLIKDSANYFSYIIGQIFKFLIISILLITFGYSGYQVFKRNSLIYCSFLLYPLITYIILFQLNFKALFCMLPMQYELTKYRICHKDMNDIPVHICSASPEDIREETERLKSDFNARMTQILFNSMLCAYYMTCVPLCFAQNSLHYNIWWICQYILLVWLGSMVLFANQYLPIKYLDVFHKCSTHLGHWAKIEARYAPHMSLTSWSELQLFPQDSTIKHVKGLFKADGICNAAEPGNAMHSRFYYMFQKPLRVTNGVLVFTLVLVFYEFTILLLTNHWNKVLSLVFLLFPNYFVLFKVLRNRFILEKIYKSV